MKRVQVRCVLMALGFFLGAGVVRAQWVTQRIPLQPGWNAVFLNVQPYPPDCDTVFSSLPFPVESVRAYNSAFSTVQYVQDISALMPVGPPWVSWFPTNAENAFARNLFRLDSGKAYFVKLPTNASPVTWELVGKPALLDIDWHPAAFNLVGFQCDETNPPTFAKFLAGSPGLVTQPVYRMNATGVWERAVGTAPMRSGEALWIKIDEHCLYQGPVDVKTDQRAGMDYGRTLSEQSLHIQNAFTNSLTVHVRTVPSGAVPSGAEPANAGSVPLSIWTTNGWQNLPADLVEAGIQPGEERVIRLAVRRQAMASYVPSPPTQAFDYQSLLDVRDDQSLSRHLVPVVSDGLAAYDASGNLINPRAGLWVGSVVINKVNQPTAESHPEAPLPTGSEFGFRVIVHVDANGVARLLQHVLLMWKDGIYTNSALVAGRYVLVTDDSLINQFSGSTLQDGEQVGRRISSPAFGFRDPLPMAGDFGSSTGVLSCATSIGYDDPLNPFKHLYHPDHDNRDALYSTNALPAGEESYTVSRGIRMAFTDRDPDGLEVPGWGDDQVGGVWRETIHGLRHQELQIEGSFRLRQASRVGVLNDGL